MKIVLTELITLQAKTVAVMFCAGVLVETMWQLKNYAKGRILRKKAKFRDKPRGVALQILTESAFWVISAIVLCRFIYYSTFGVLTLYSAAGFFVGLLLWKKICCAIIKEVWVEKEEAENLETTARSSISIRPEKKGWKKGGQKRQRKKKE